MFGTALGDHRLDTAIAQRAPMSLGVVTAIRVDHTRPLQWVATQSADRRNRVDQRQQLRDVVDVRAGQDRGERRTVGVGDDVVLGTGSRATGGVWPSFWPAPTARIDDESTAAREKSIWSAARSFASSNSCKRSQTPAACQSRSRRQHVTPEPHPISAGRSRQRSPVLRTNRMPVSAARFETGRRPGFFSRRGLGGGSNGSISVHNSSSMIGLAISSVSVVPMPEVNSSPRKLTAPRGLFETVSKGLWENTRTKPSWRRSEITAPASPASKLLLNGMASMFRRCGNGLQVIGLMARKACGRRSGLPRISALNSNFES